MRNIMLDICYDGTRYRGWQRQSSSDQTIQAKLETAIGRILGEPIELLASGRTDAGVHALHQIANFHCESSMPCAELLKQLRSYLPEDIGIYSCKEASPRFHARLNAKTKTYRYRIWNSDQPCVFERRYVYIFRQEVDLDRMREAADTLLGTHDFSAFCANAKMKKSTVRRIDLIQIERQGNELVFEFTGNGFLYNMVRILVGTLLEVGTGKRNSSDIPKLFGGKRETAGERVPACGLCLMEVTY